MILRNFNSERNIIKLKMRLNHNLWMNERFHSFMWKNSSQVNLNQTNRTTRNKPKQAETSLSKHTQTEWDLILTVNARFQLEINFETNAYSLLQISTIQNYEFNKSNNDYPIRGG
jgi:hypothetical protein